MLREVLQKWINTIQ